MNVTLKLPDDLLRDARHRALDENRSLSALVADLLRERLANPMAPLNRPRTWMDAFSGDENDEFLDRDIPLPDRKGMKEREINLED